jgi:L-ribulose-5-phosphate 4-epimerase
MILPLLRKAVLNANLELVRRGLVLYTFGNVSGIDRHRSIVVIKPSGVPYEKMKPADMVAVDLYSGKIVEGNLRPSSDLATHLILYREFPRIGGIVHTHSHCATVWAQAGREIPCFGTTHADYFHGPVPVTAALTREEIETEYEANTGHAIVRHFRDLDPMARPGVLVHGHAPFTWGATVAEAVHNAVVLEAIARMALDTRMVNAEANPISQHLLDKHFHRKHGSNAYYGQKKKT